MHYLVYVFSKSPKPDLNSILESHGDGREWDWFERGGRWTGHLSGYDPTADPANWETCDLCDGTGTRTAPVPTNPNWTPVPGQCNGCDQWKGKLPLGKRVRFGFEPHPGDTQRVADILGLLPQSPPAAFMRDDSDTWYSSEAHNPDFDEKSGDYSNYMIPNPDFRTSFAETLVAYTTYYVTVVDCHN